MSGSEVHLQEATVPLIVRQSDLDLLAEPPASKNSRVDSRKVIGCPNQEDLMLRPKVADLIEGLLHQLNVMLAPVPCDRREQRIHFVEEED